LVTVTGPAAAQSAADADELNAEVMRLYQAGEYAEAIPLAQMALTVREKTLGPEHSDVGKSLNDLAELYRAQGRTTEAEPLMKRGLALREKALGPEHPDVGTSLNNLARLYQALGRFAEAEPLYKRSITILEKALRPEHPAVCTPRNNLAVLYLEQDRFAEAEPMFQRCLAVRENALGYDHPDVAESLNNLAELYWAQGRATEAEPFNKRAISVVEKALGPEHPHVGTALNNLAGLYQSQGRSAEAEPLYQRSLALRLKALGPEHLDVSVSLHNLAALARDRNDIAAAAGFSLRATAVMQRRAERGLGSTSKGTSKGEAHRYNFVFDSLVKTTQRLAPAGGDEVWRRATDMFETAQWGHGSVAAMSLAQMAARSAGGSPGLAALVRERQDLVGEWSAKDKQLIAARSEPPAKRNAAAEKALGDRLAAIDARLADIDARFAKEFPDYAALSSPKPVSVADVQARLRADEALLLFLDTDDRFKPLPEETFVWVVTKTEVRWLRSELGTAALQREVAALRCGLDNTNWTDATNWPEGDDRERQLKQSQIARRDRCKALTGLDVSDTDMPPFDTTRAHALYKGLLGEAADLIHGKNLLIVPSGALTTLPFQVLVTELPAGTVVGKIPREVGRLGAELGPLTDEERKSLGEISQAGVKVIKPVPGGPAEMAGLRAGDILLAINDRGFPTVPEAVAAVQATGPGQAAKLKLMRERQALLLPVTLGSLTVHDWKPLWLDANNAKAVRWLIRDHAITVLPSVSSLTALRRTGKPSVAPKPMIGFANPLLDGFGASQKARAQLARDHTGCAAATKQRTAELRSIVRTASPVPQSAGLADLAQIARQSPLPETADEVCEVARLVGAVTGEMRIGARATEAEVKRLSAAGELARYRILHFATHGLLAGQLSSTREPGLILTPPKAATAEDDGYLSGGEIAGLKLDADWVILSACNTAAGGGSDDSGLAGIARAFLYAGGRNLLASHWAVRDDAAAYLSVETVKRYGRGADPAGALRKAMLRMIDGKPFEGADQPVNWAPFVFVGR
jgi:CHAT domain-containing protein/tetratricopeptide (TPR) repeat protein